MTGLGYRVWMTVVTSTPTERPESVINRCLIEVFVLSIGFRIFLLV